MRNKYAFSLLVAVVMAPVAAQAPRSYPDLTEARRTLEAARNAAENYVDRRGSLPPEKWNAIEKLLGNANQVWTACLRIAAEGNNRRADGRVTVDDIMRTCASDRQEVAAWFRLFARITNQSTSDSDREMAKLDAANRQQIAERIRALQR